MKIILKNFKLTIVVVFLSLSSCSNGQNHNWIVYSDKETGLGSQDELFNKILVKEDGFLLLGEERDFSDVAKNKSLIYLSKNGSNWIKLYEGKGEVVDGYCLKNNLFFFQNEYTDNSLETNFLSLRKINLNSKNVGEIHKFQTNSTINNVRIDKSGCVTLIVNNSLSANDFSVFKSKDDFNSYDHISIDKPIKKSFITDDKVYFLTHEFFIKNYETYEINDFFIINESEKIDSLNLQLNATDFLIDTSGKMWILYQKGDSVKLVEKGKSNNREYVISNNQDENPVKLYKYNNFIAVLTNVIDADGFNGFGKTKYKLYLSFNDGQTFEKEALPIDDYVGAIGFYKNEKVIIYSGAGRISLCKFNKS